MISRYKRYMGPLPADLESAYREIASLHSQLRRQNMQLAKMAEKNELVRRSMAGQVKQLQDELKALRGKR